MHPIWTFYMRSEMFVPPDRVNDSSQVNLLENVFKIDPNVA